MGERIPADRLAEIRAEADHKELGCYLDPGDLHVDRDEVRALVDMAAEAGTLRALIQSLCRDAYIGADGTAGATVWIEDAVPITTRDADLLRRMLAGGPC